MKTAMKQGWGFGPGEFLAGWWNILNGRAPLLSIESTRECPLHCPGYYAYGRDHLGVGAPTLREVSDFRGDALINGVLDLVSKHRPLHVWPPFACFDRDWTSSRFRVRGTVALPRWRTALEQEENQSPLVQIRTSGW